MSMQLTSTVYANTSLLSFTNSLSNGMMYVAYNSSSWNDFVQKVTKVITQAFSFVDHALSLPILGAKAQPQSFRATNGGFNSGWGADGAAFWGGSHEFRKFKDRVEETSKAMAPLIKICQADAEKCGQNSLERQTAMEKLANILNRVLPGKLTESNYEIADCLIPYKCSSIGCKDEELIKVKEKTVCIPNYSAPSYGCLSFAHIGPFFLPLFCGPTSTSKTESCFKRELDASVRYCKIHPREKAAAQTIHSRSSVANWVKSFFVPPEWKDYFEFLRFRADDPREKALFVVANDDHNGALAPKFDMSILAPLSQKYDIRYQVVKTVDNIRESVDNAAKTGKLAAVFINAHASPFMACLSNCSEKEKKKLNWKTDLISRERTDFDFVFKGLETNGKIFLLACSTGTDSLTVVNSETKVETTYSFVDEKGERVHLAQKMADGAKRTVIAANGHVIGARTSFLASDASMLYHPSGFLVSLIPFYDTNIFHPFKPEFKQCSAVNIDKLHEKELQANKDIKDTLVSHSLLTDKEKKLQADYLTLCADDPRNKFLYFTADFDDSKTKVLSSGNDKELLGMLADKFDLEYSIVKSKDEICLKVDQAAAFGKIAGIVISATGSPTEGLRLSKDAYLQAKDDFTKCFAKLEKNGVIVLSGGSVGKNGEDPNNLAQKIADDSQTTVLAPTCTIRPKQVVVQSFNPFILHHPQRGFLENMFNFCSENNQNIFKTFHPKQKI